jgi:mevalonate kinase
MEIGDEKRLGQLMWENHDYLREMTVSAEKLDLLVAAAKAAGALGAKLSGAGRGGNMIALVEAANEASVRRSLLDAGARSILTSVLDNQRLNSLTQ